MYSWLPYQSSILNHNGDKSNLLPKPVLTDVMDNILWTLVVYIVQLIAMYYG